MAECTYKYITKPSQCTYKNITRPSQRTYKNITKPSQRTYKNITKPSQCTYKNVTKPCKRTYKNVTKPSQRTYKNVTKPNQLYTLLAIQRHQLKSSKYTCTNFKHLHVGSYSNWRELYIRCPDKGMWTLVKTTINWYFIQAYCYTIQWSIII